MRQRLPIEPTEEASLIMDRQALLPAGQPVAWQRVPLRRLHFQAAASEPRGARSVVQVCFDALPSLPLQHLLVLDGSRKVFSIGSMVCGGHELSAGEMLLAISYYDGHPTVCIDLYGGTVTLGQLGVQMDLLSTHPGGAALHVRARLG